MTRGYVFDCSIVVLLLLLRISSISRLSGDICFPDEFSAHKLVKFSFGVLGLVYFNLLLSIFHLCGEAILVLLVWGYFRQRVSRYPNKSFNC